MLFDLLLPLDEPGSRLFHWNLVMAALLAMGWAIFTFGRPSNLPEVRDHVHRLFLDTRYWWNKSTRRDYGLFVLNAVLKVVWFIPLLDFSFHIARFTSKSLLWANGDFLGVKTTAFAVAVFTVFSFVWDDFLRFFHHRLMHSYPMLWRLHSVHHSAKVLTPVTLYRTHPLESAMATVRNSLSLGVSTGIFIFIFEAQLSVWTIAGVNVLGFMFNFLGANLRHSHIPLRFPSWLEKIFISPLQHQIHHSSHEQHRDKNFGVTLSLWDHLFGSWVGSKGVGRLRFGLGDRQLRPLLEEIGLSKYQRVKIKGGIYEVIYWVYDLIGRGRARIRRRSHQVHERVL